MLKVSTGPLKLPLESLFLDAEKVKDLGRPEKFVARDFIAEALQVLDKGNDLLMVLMARCTAALRHHVAATFADDKRARLF